MRYRQITESWWDVERSAAPLVRNVRQFRDGDDELFPRPVCWESPEGFDKPEPVPVRRRRLSDGFPGDGCLEQALGAVLDREIQIVAGAAGGDLGFAEPVAVTTGDDKFGHRIAVAAFLVARQAMGGAEHGPVVLVECWNAFGCVLVAGGMFEPGE